MAYETRLYSHELPIHGMKHEVWVMKAERRRMRNHQPASDKELTSHPAWVRRAGRTNIPPRLGATWQKSNSDPGRRRNDDGQERSREERSSDGAGAGGSGRDDPDDEKDGTSESSEDYELGNCDYHLDQYLQWFFFTKRQ